MNVRLFLLCIMLLCLSCSKSDDDPTMPIDQETPTLVKRVLFIGNSHTNYNGGIDAQLRGFAQADQITTTVAKQAPGGFTLEDHLNSSATLNTLASEQWDVIILQENTFRAAYHPEDMLESIAQFEEVLANSPAKIYLFKTWAYSDAPEMNALLDTAYQQAQSQSSFSTLSIGSYWINYQSLHQDNLYSDDGIHPSVVGTYLCGGIFYKKIFGIDDLNLSTYDYVLDAQQASRIKSFISDLNL